MDATAVVYGDPLSLAGFHREAAACVVESAMARTEE